MAVPRFLQLLHRAGWEFWLPLPLIAALFWLVGSNITAQVLKRPYQSVSKLQADTQIAAKGGVTVLAINAEIDRARGVTTILLKTTDSTLKQSAYEFPVIQASEVEAAIAQKLDLPIETVRKLISYRFID